MPTGRMAFANARVRALKSRLLTAEARRARAADLRPALDLVDCYRVVLECLPGGRALTLALLRRHEIENVKLLWRAVTRGSSFERWFGLWRPLQPLATVDLERVRDCTSLPQVVDALQNSPYASVAEAMLRTHREDLLASELGFDRWMSRQVLAAALALDRQDAACELACSVVGERDLELLRRGISVFALSADVVVGTLVFLPRVLTMEVLARLVTWTPEEGALATRWPQSWQRLVGRAADWDAVVLRWRRARYQQCRRAFLGQPFCLAPAIALLLLAEEEARGVSALAVAGGEPAAAPALTFALAASVLGD